MTGMLVFAWGMAQSRPEGRGPVLILAAAIVGFGVLISLYNIWKARGLQREIDALMSLGATRADGRL